MQQSSTPLTQAERTAISDKAMLDAAMDLVLEHGTDRTTLAMIGEKAGYSRGLATYRFGSKGGLYDALCKSISRHWLEYLKQGVGDKVGIDAMCAALDTIYRFEQESPKEARALQILYSGAASPSAEFQGTAVGIRRRQKSDVADWVRQGQDSGQIRAEINADEVAAQYVAYISGMTYLWMMSPDTFDFSVANEVMKRHLRDSLAA
ncbi:MAG: TetR/AcrR family transcriptional regulator [Gammaproteobacteria bacterium]|nr:TetR/AcrR family transcriptional regulator [Gammaproteobacteria bacterium]MBU2676931.1 TetR/AcrR family transcriptional regulator [Gammaproteobacteria bacterium]NNL50664.1 TetR/AcrR family transcriptional regulator [Woeseiaceae bacterium]